MALKLNVGISKKVGLPGYSSLGASCHIEVDLDQSLLFENLDGFHQRAKHIYTACRDAVTNELARHHDTAAAEVPSGQTTAGVTSDTVTSDAITSETLSNGHNGHRAS